MKKMITSLIGVGGLLLSPLSFASNPIELSLGVESYKETYREYENGERFMQQAGRLNALSGSAQYYIDNHHSVKLEGRYAKGKIDYTGGENPSEDNPEGTPYGSIKQNNLPRRSYDIRSMYVYQQSINPNLSIIGEVGLGYRVLKDLSSKANPEDYDRKNKTAYIQVGVGTKIAFAKGYDFSPKISYNHGIYGKQYSFLDNGTVPLKQHNARGLEVELPISKTFANQTKISYVPFYRGWSVPDSDVFTRVEVDDNGEAVLATYKEPRNRTHEIGVKLKYTF